MVDTGLRKQQPQKRRVQRISGTQDLTVGSAPKFSLLTVRDIRNVQSISSHAYIKSETASRGGFSLYKDASNRSVLSVDMIQVRGNWKINATSIYTGTEDFSGYTTNAGDITIYSDGSNASIHAKNFYINTAGVLTAQSVVLSGALTATSGAIGGWTINATSIYTGTEDHAGYTGSAGDMTLYAAGGNASIHAANWYIDTSGNMEVKGGHIANWTIVQGALFTGSDDHSGYTTNAGDMTLYSDGSNASIHAKNFYIDASGSMVAQSVTLVGAITATSGGIGGWTINSTSIYTGTEDHAAYTANAGDLTIYSNGSDASIHAKLWYINTAGKLFANTGDFAGAITSSATITGGTFQTASSGQRVVITGTNITFYPASGGFVVLWGISSGRVQVSGNLTVVGSLDAATFVDAAGGFKDNGTAGIDFSGAVSNITVSGGIVTAAS